MATQTLLVNSNLSAEFQTDIFNILTKIVNYFNSREYQGPYTDIQLTLPVLSKMRIVGTSIVNEDKLLAYADFAKNELRISEKLLKHPGVDAEQLIVIHILMVLSPSEDIRTLVIGNAASTASRIVGNDSDVPDDKIVVLYEEEQTLCNLLSRVLPTDAVLGLCFNNDRKGLENALIERNISKEEFDNFIIQVGYINVCKDPEEKKRACKQCQELLIGMFTHSPRTMDEVTSFEPNLDPEMAEYFRKEVIPQMNIVQPQAGQTTQVTQEQAKHM